MKTKDSGPDIGNPDDGSPEGGVPEDGNRSNAPSPEETRGNDASPPSLRARFVETVRNPRPAALIGFALAVMIAAALLSAGHLAEDPPVEEGPAAAPVPTSP